MKLISATPSPYARKIRIALAEKGIPFAGLARYLDGLMERPSFQTTVPFPQTIDAGVA